MSDTFAFELSWASQSKLTNSPLTTSSFHLKKFDAFELFGAEKNLPRFETLKIAFESESK